MDLCLHFIDTPLSDLSCVSAVVCYYFSTPRLSATLAVNGKEKKYLTEINEQKNMKKNYK